MIGGLEDCMDEDKLEDLVSVGRTICRDFAKHEPDNLYRKLCRKVGTRLDPCVLDTFRAAVAQARDPKLPLQKCRWWYWSRVRKASAVGRQT